MLKNFQILIGPRPGKKSKDAIRDMGATKILTLLGDNEQPKNIAKIADEIGASWLHFPIEGGKPDILKTIKLNEFFEYLQCQSLSENDKVYIHCSAGIHRTGFIVYLLLRKRGLTDKNARLELSSIRTVTAEQVGENRLDLAQTMFENGY